MKAVFFNKANKLKLYYHKLRTTPLPIVVKQAWGMFTRRTDKEFSRLHDNLFGTFINFAETTMPLKPLEISNLDITGINADIAEELIKMWLSHRFDLLGSGWIEAAYKNNAPGFEGFIYNSPDFKDKPADYILEQVLLPRDHKNAKNIWKYIPDSHKPIDWQKDFKSGFRWCAKKWYRNQSIADKPGGDIKVPWELSRLQHLPRLAIFSIKFTEKRNIIVQEFCSQFLDFIAQNPPRMGVNWTCTMDVGIRTANLALAYSIFKSSGVVFPAWFEILFSNSIFAHCHHIFTNLEWNEVLTSNHYFANIAGLLFGAAILPDCKKKKKWLSFAGREIRNEIIKQFAQEGSNKEGSVAYHRLTGEMALYSVALITGLAKTASTESLTESLNEEILNRVFGMGCFMQDVTRPDNTLSQIGDNDSGAFFRLTPFGGMIPPEEAAKLYRNLANYKPDKNDKIYFDEDTNNSIPFISAVNGLFDSGRFIKESQICPLENSMVKAFAKSTTYTGKFNAAPPAFDNRDDKLEFEQTNSFKFNKIDVHNITVTSYPEFGVYIFRSNLLYLIVNAADNGQRGNAGHAHNDKLSFELFVNGKSIFEDPGVYVYTASSEIRNKYRSIKMHNTIDTGIEQNKYISLFCMSNDTRCCLTQLSETSITLIVEYSGVIHKRTINIESGYLVIIDNCNRQFKTNFAQHAVAKGYGKVIAGETKT